MQYYVMKVGFPMLDACRAYGLGLVIEHLAEKATIPRDVTIRDAGALYLVEGPRIEELTISPASGLFAELLEVTDGWCRVLLTIGRKTRADRLSPPCRRRVETKIAGVGEELLDYLGVLEHFSHCAGYVVTTTMSRVEALELSSDERDYARVLIDLTLPPLDGLELAASIHRRNPRTAVILISGYFYPDDQAIIEGIRKGLLAGFISKPFDLKEVRRVVCRAVQ